jgi:phosphatidylglycerol:prolipoprotein diacylglycerol transferase
MYPNLYYLFEDLFGVSLPFLHLLQSFGFMVAVSFILANLTMVMEMKRKEREGLLHPVKKRITAAAVKQERQWDIAGSFVLGFLLGFKVIAAFLSGDVAIAKVHDFLLSFEGNWPLGIFIGAVFGAWRYYKLKQLPLPEKDKELLVHPYQIMGSLTIAAAVSGLLGAKIFHNLENWDSFAADPVGSLLSFSGLTFYGGLICGGAAVLYLAAKNGIHWKHMIDVGAPAMMLAYGVGRIGCHVSGDGDWGIVNTADKPSWLSWAPDWLWAYRYPNNVLGEGIPIPGCTGNYCNQLPFPVYPTPLYEAAVCIGLFFLLWFLRRRISIPGMLFFVYLVLNGLERFFIEKIRVNNKMSVGGLELTQAEIISFLLILAGISGAAYLYATRKKSVASGIKKA